MVTVVMTESIGYATTQPSCRAPIDTGHDRPNDARAAIM